MIVLLGVLPLWCNRKLGALLGYLAWLSGAKAAKLCLDNIASCFPELTGTQQRQLAKHSMIETGKTAGETASIWRQPHRRIRRYINAVDGLDKLQRNFDRGRGVLLLLPHLGNWEVLGQFVPQHFPYTAMYQPADDPSMDVVMRKGRLREGMKLAPANRQGVAQALKALRAGEIVTVLPDQVPKPGSGEATEFFGQPAMTMTLVHKLIQHTGCAVMMGVAERDNNGFHLYFTEPHSDIYHADCNSSLRGLNRSIEQCVNKIPQQYQWEYNRFKLSKNHPTAS